MKSLTVAKRIVLGFFLVLSIFVLLGIGTSLKLRILARAANDVSGAVVPLNTSATKLLAAMDDFRLQARMYGFTGSPEDLARVQTALERVQESEKAAKNLVSANPVLASAGQAMGEFQSSLVEYGNVLAATVEIQEKMSEIQARLRDNASSATKEAEKFLSNMLEAQGKELVDAEKTSKQHVERAWKIVAANRVVNILDETRVENFRSQSDRDSGIFLKALPRLDEALTILAELEPTVRQSVNKQQLESVATSIRSYQALGREYAAQSQSLEANNKIRATTGEKAAAATIALADFASGTTGTSSAGIASGLNLTTGAIAIGTALATVVAIVLAIWLTRGINRVLSQAVTELTNGSDQVASASGEISAASQSLAEGASEQAASLEETSASLEEIASMTRHNADNAETAKNLAFSTRQSAEAGTADMQAMKSAMADIKNASDNIAKIIKTIDEIAFQTNILALNAAVEAARAGDAGMGFAVVADEVRNLAQRSAGAARETAEKIEDSIRKSQAGVSISAKVGASLEEIVAKARQVDDLVAEIANASREQTQGIDQVNVAVTQMDKVTQNNAASAEESASASEQLNAQAQSLRDIVAGLELLVGGRVSR